MFDPQIEAERLIQAPTAVERAVLGDHGPRQRKAILAAWVEQIEAKQGYESNLTAWLKAIAEALGPDDAVEGER